MPGSGERSLQALLATMKPTLPLHSLQPEMLFREPEGLTIIASKTLAESHGFGCADYVFPCKKLSLTVHSSLEAVGLLAAITNRFAERSISTTVVSGYFHDHIFVAVGSEETAMRVLEEMMEDALVHGCL
ncbi:hypothetical protein MPDQ_007828 [Monascus purpureus]|uniref:DUF2241 domain-containing protein n=1 Tax=Monascus purpureus TaxID=5098 RepID=A0A507QV60_MONPU|nr:hypothetical protein MPDQ_007828 [Monascus purpureus]BDD61142.1 hypothetical protein MAP00_006213 [Monascus purpureus]